MNETEFDEILRAGYEQRGREFKGPGRRDDSHYLARVARAVLGMANHRDGGLVILGVEESAGTLRPAGLSDSDLATWKYDDVATALAVYADPVVTFDLEVVLYDNASFVALTVQEFEDIPILCNRDYQDQQPVLRKGACYVRSRHKPETSEIPSHEEMRELLDLAIDKGLRKFVARARAAGLLGWAPTPSSPTDEELFREQAKDLQ